MDTKFRSLRDASKDLGLSYKYLRMGCLSGEIPCIRSGDGKNAKFYINMPLFLEKLDRKNPES